MRSLDLRRPLAARCQHGGSPLSAEARDQITAWAVDSHGPGKHARGEAGARSEGHSESREVSLLSTAAPVAEKPVSNFLPGEKPTWDLYSKCVHCGLCLDQCPTYRALGTEMDSPRGRIYQMVQVDEGRLALGESFVTHIDRCLGCLNCQTACPSGVPYGSLLERARSQIVEHYRRPVAAAHNSHTFLRADTAVVRRAWRDMRSSCASISAPACRAWRAQRAC